jgi:hypothetical protein
MTRETEYAKLVSATRLELCSICGAPYSGDANEAEPVKDGRCCDDCNAKHVIPARLAELRAAERAAGPPRQRRRTS